MTRLHDGGRRVSATATRIARRDGWTCGRCGDPIDPTLPRLAPLGLSIGHVIPQAHGGSDVDANLRAEHLACNRDAGARFLGEGVEYRKRTFPPNGAQIRLVASIRK